jgi:hypothetical protein
MFNQQNLTDFSAAIILRVVDYFSADTFVSAHRLDMILEHLFVMCGGMPHVVMDEDIAVAAIAVDWIKSKKTDGYQSFLALR